MIREYVSVLPPGGKGTMKRIGRDGYDCAQAEVVAAIPDTARATTSIAARAFTASRGRFLRHRSLVHQIDCDTYLVSTDGSRFGHPDDEAIERILDRGAHETRLVFNYRSEQNAKWAGEETQRERHYTAIYPRSESGGVAVDLMDQTAMSQEWAS